MADYELHKLRLEVRELGSMEYPSKHVQDIRGRWKLLSVACIYSPGNEYVTEARCLGAVKWLDEYIAFLVSRS